MEYKKAAEVLPEALLRELQQYAEGCLLYIPNKGGRRRGWGDATDTKTFLNARNREICFDRKSGMALKHIALKYHLAESTVRKILSRK